MLSVTVTMTGRLEDHLRTLSDKSRMAPADYLKQVFEMFLIEKRQREREAQQSRLHARDAEESHG